MFVDFIGHLCINKTSYSSQLLVVESGFYFEGTLPVTDLLLHSEAWVHERGEMSRMWRSGTSLWPTSSLTYIVTSHVPCICRTRDVCRTEARAHNDPWRCKRSSSVNQTDRWVNISISCKHSSSSRPHPRYVPARWACPPPLRTPWGACSPRAPHCGPPGSKQWTWSWARARKTLRAADRRRAGPEADGNKPGDDNNENNNNDKKKKKKNTIIRTKIQATIN